MLRDKLKRIFEGDTFQTVIISVIIVNSILIGMETSPFVMRNFGAYIDEIDLIILGIFVLEMILKGYAYRLRFFTNAWNVFDLSVVLISILPAAGSFAVFRALRILRTLRLLKNIPKLKIIITSLLRVIPSLGWVMVLLMIIFYVFAVIGTNIYGPQFPQYFGSLGKTMFTLFQVMTLESWSSGIARPIISEMPFATVYFIMFILIATYTTLNFFIAIVVNTMNEIQHTELQNEEQNIKDFVTQENKVLKQQMSEMADEIKDLKSLLQKQ
jgi:voltage-gated sodium channel